MEIANSDSIKANVIPFIQSISIFSNTKSNWRDGGWSNNKKKNERILIVSGEGADSWTLGVSEHGTRPRVSFEDPRQDSQVHQQGQSGKNSSKTNLDMKNIVRINFQIQFADTMYWWSEFSSYFEMTSWFWSLQKNLLFWEMILGAK